MSARNILLAAGGSADDKLYVDDVFSAYTYTGNSSTQTINNGIDLAGKGGLVWIKARNHTLDNMVVDTVRGVGQYSSLQTNTSNPATNFNVGPDFTAFNSNGFTLGVPTWTGSFNSSYSYISWTFRRAPKFFDVVTWTGSGVNRTIPHALGQEVGMILVKRTDSAENWQVYHRSLANTEYMVLNSTVAKATGATLWNSTTPTSAVFSLGTNASVNASGGTYVAYLFAHDASADGIVQCGSYVGNGVNVGPSVTLGWEPQFLIIKKVNAVGGWRIFDVMRGITSGGSSAADPSLTSNAADAEDTVQGYVDLTPTGFSIHTNGAETNTNGSTYIYLAIRRPNKPPTTGTQVYNSVVRISASAGGDATLSVGFPTDTALIESQDGWGAAFFTDRLRGATNKLTTYDTSTEASNSSYGVVKTFGMTAVVILEVPKTRKSVNHFFRRAPGFFDVVCYTGNYTGSNAPLIPHNLGVKPELLIQKKRSGSMALEWYVLSDTVLGTGVSRYSILNGTSAFQGVSGFLAPTSAGFPAFQAADPCVAYLFASLLGISKVGSYTGNGSSQTIDCGFTTGARFILIKKTSGTGDWLVADTARGIVSAGDPRLSLNTMAAEVTGEDWLDPDATGFIINQTTADANASAASYIFLAIA